MPGEPDNEAPAGRGRRRPRLRRRLPRGAIPFAGVLVAGVLIGWVLFHDDGSGPAPRKSTTAPAQRQARASVDVSVYPRFGLTLGVPKGWRTSIRRGVLNAASADRSVSVALSVAGGPGDGRKVRRTDRVQLARLFKARELSRRRTQVGGAPTIVTELLGRTPRGQRIRILSMAASSRWRTYSAQVFTVPAPSTAHLLELRTLLTAVTYSRPR
ncbi:MAG: hypothetical protein QOE11_10 [Solirubrobacteraceae bacterium]|nr:hypothetical protein [Solirubrobacteraceae bacterium]